jgi:formyltetrahydrofolate deformylase
MRYTLQISCPDRAGIVAAVSARITGSGANIDELSQFGDFNTGRFFMRVLLSSGEQDPEVLMLRAGMASVASHFGMRWNLQPADEKKRVLLMVSKFDHCLRDLLYRQETRTLDVRFTAIVSNHQDLGPIADRAGLPFHWIPLTREGKSEAEAELRRIIDQTRSELIVLARYMQVLSPQFCADFPARIINIHHSFLPSFKGAKPYHQAHERGVKVIGATAHYVTNDLDEGPIIEQSVERVHHGLAPDELIAIGRDVEAITLARAVTLHVQGRVFLNGHRTVVFDR